MMDTNMKKLLCDDVLYDRRSLVYENGTLRSEGPNVVSHLERPGEALPTELV